MKKMTRQAVNAELKFSKLFWRFNYQFIMFTMMELCALSCRCVEYDSKHYK